MKKTVQYNLPPQIAFDPERFQEFVLKKLNINASDHVSIRMTRRSVDSRTQKIKVNVSADIFINEIVPPLLEYQTMLLLQKIRLIYYQN